MQQQIVLFPSDSGISELRGVLKLIKDNNRAHTMKMSELLFHSHKRFEELNGILQSCKLLGLVTVNNGTIRLTRTGAQMKVDNFRSMLKSYLIEIEPFKATREALRHREHMSTKELSQYLRHRGVAFVTDEKQNEELLRYVLLKWAVRSGLLEYDVHSDRWRTL